jgi:hypothetical protein
MMQIPILLSLLSILTTFTSARSWVTSDKCPIKIKAVVGGDCYGDLSPTKDVKFDTLDSIHAALTGCPNITKLDLRILDLDCMKSPDVRGFPFNPSGGERFANLTSIRLEGYEFTGRPWWNESPEENVIVQWLNKGLAAVKIDQLVQGLFNIVPKKTHLDLWMDAMDWSRVEELAVTGALGDSITNEVVSKLAPRLASLRSLESSNARFIAALPDNVLTHLKYISYKHTTEDLSVILAQQGKSLENFDFHYPELQQGPLLPDSPDLSVLPAKTRNLTHLAINIPRNGTWPLETLSTIAALPHLQSLDVYLTLQSLCAQQRSSYAEYREYGGENCRGEEQYQTPFVDKHGAEEMFGYLKEKKKGVKLKNVTFYVGDWMEGERYASCEGKDWFEGRKAKVVCREDRVGDEGWCIVEAGEEYWKED